MTASKRHDRELLSDINARLENASFKQPVVIRRTTASYTTQKNKPPLPPGRGGGGGGGPSTWYSGTAAVRSKLGRSYVDDDEDYAFPSTPVTTSIIRGSRATSVPPRMPSVPVVQTYGSGLGPTTKTTTYHWNGPKTTTTTKILDGPRSYGYSPYLDEELRFENPPLHQPVRTVVTSGKGHHISPVADLAIKQAHRNLDRIENELKFSSQDYNSAPRLATQSLMGVGYDLQEPARRTTYRYPSPSTYRRPTIRTTSLSPSRTYRRYVDSPVDNDISFAFETVPVTSYSYSTRKTPQPAPVIEEQIKRDVFKPQRAEIEEFQMFPLEMYMTRSEPTFNRISAHTGSLPPPPLPPSAVSYRETITDSVPRSTYATTTRHYVPGGSSQWSTKSSYPVTDGINLNLLGDVSIKTIVPPTSLSATPIRHGPTSIDSAPVPMPTTGRPKVSETRRKVREVLCKVKNDPHYFD